MKKLLLKSILLLCGLVAGTSAWATESTYTADFSTNGSAFSSTTQSVTITNNNLEATWGVSVTWLGSGSYWGSDKNATQIGASKSGSTERAAKKIVISTSDIPGTISSVVINAASNSSTGTLGVKVGSTSFSINSSTTTTLTGTLTGYTFTGSATGAIEMTFDNTVSGKYFKIGTIVVTYTTGGGGSDPSISLSSNSIDATVAEKNGTINVTYNNLTNYDADVIFYESDGTTAATYDHSWLTAEINASTKNLDYSITANTGAARTAYLKVYALGDEGDAESSLITVTQAAKTVASPTFSLDGNKSYWQGTELTLTSEGNTIYYTSTTDGTDPANPTAGSTEYTAPIALPSSSYKIKAIAYDVYGNKSSVVTRTYTGVAVATLPFSWDENETSTTGVISSSVGTYDSSPHLKFDATNDNLILHFDGIPGTLSFDIKGNTFSGGTFTVQTSSDGSAYTDLASYTTLGDKETKSYKLSADVRYIKWIYTSKDKGNVALGNINLLPVPDEPSVPVVAGETVTLTTTTNMAGWRTFAPIKADQNYTVDGTTKVYYASATADGKVSLAEIAEGVPANTPVILHQTSGTTITLTETATNITAPGSNLLQVSTASQDLGTVYRLGYKSTYGVGFYTYTTNSAPAGIVYLETVTAAHEFLGFDFDGETTAINNLTPSLSKGEGEYYDLQGRKVAQPTKGLYIVNGKKVIVK